MSLHHINANFLSASIQHWHWYLHCTISPNNTNISYFFWSPLCLIIFDLILTTNIKNISDAAQHSTRLKMKTETWLKLVFVQSFYFTDIRSCLPKSLNVFTKYCQNYKTSFWRIQWNQKMCSSVMKCIDDKDNIINKRKLCMLIIIVLYIDSSIKITLVTYVAGVACPISSSYEADADGR